MSEGGCVSTEEAFIDASREGDVDAVRKYIDTGGNVNYQTTRAVSWRKNIHTGDTGLLLATTYERTEIVKLLLDAGADPNIQSKDGRTPLMSSAYQGYIGIMVALIESGADINIQDKYGRTALMEASFQSQVDIINLLIKLGAHTNIQNVDGETSLIIASDRGHTAVVSALLEHGADLNIQDNDGKSALTLAKKARIKSLIRNQIRLNRWNSRKALLIMLAENGYSRPSTSLPSPLRFQSVLGNEGLVRLIVSYI